MSNLANTRQIRFVRRTSSYWRVTFDNPPLNIFGPETIPELSEIVTALADDPGLQDRIELLVTNCAFNYIVKCAFLLSQLLNSLVTHRG